MKMNLESADIAVSLHLTELEAETLKCDTLIEIVGLLNDKGEDFINSHPITEKDYRYERDIPQDVALSETEKKCIVSNAKIALTYAKAIQAIESLVND